MVTTQHTSNAPHNLSSPFMPGEFVESDLIGTVGCKSLWRSTDTREATGNAASLMRDPVTDAETLAVGSIGESGAAWAIFGHAG